MSEQPDREDSQLTDVSGWVDTALDGIAEEEAETQLQRLRDIQARLRATFARIKDA